MAGIARHRETAGRAREEVEAAGGGEHGQSWHHPCREGCEDFKLTTTLT